MPNHKEPADFDALAMVAGGVTVARPVFSIVIYTRVPLQSHGPALESLQNSFWSRCGHLPSWYYVNEKMASHKPVTRRTLGMLRAWTRPSAPEREFVALELKQGEPFNAAAEFMFKVLGTQPGTAVYNDGDANMVSMSFPATWARERRDELRALAMEMFEIMPIVSGHAGFSFELSRYFEMGAQSHAWMQSMRHRGIDISKPSTDCAAVSTDGLKGVSWLTMLGSELARSVALDGPGLNRLPRSVKIERLATGVMIEADDQPLVGDTANKDDLASYKAVFRRLRPLIERFAARYGAMWLMLKVSEDKTRDWIFRLAR